MARCSRPPRGALLVRIPASDDGWAGLLPQVPEPDGPLTVTVGPLARVAAEQLRAAGYRVVGTHATACLPDGRPAAGVLVPAAIRARHPGCWQRLRAAATRIYQLDHGPVLLALDGELALHLPAGGSAAHPHGGT